MFAADVAVAGGGPAATAAVALARLGVRPISSAPWPTTTSARRSATDSNAKASTSASWLSCRTRVAAERDPRGARVRHARDRRRSPGRPRPRCGSTPRAESSSAPSCVGARRPAGYRPRPATSACRSTAGPDREPRPARPSPSTPRRRACCSRSSGTAKAALEAGAERVVVTRGSKGSTAYTRDGETIDAGPRLETVSTAGPGDVLHGALLAGLVRDVPLREALAFANCAARSAERSTDARRSRRPMRCRRPASEAARASSPARAAL